MKLLLHMCCAPCSVYPGIVLSGEGINYEGFFYNPNIHPYEEFQRRRDNVAKYGDLKGITINYIDESDQEKWENFTGCAEERCSMCYFTRLEKTAQFASQHGFDAFTTTLLVSPYQKHDLIKNIAEDFSKEYNIDFYYKDFRSGFREGQRLAKEMGLYRQKYCGCIISFKEAAFSKGS